MCREVPCEGYNDRPMKEKKAVLLLAFAAAVLIFGSVLHTKLETDSHTAEKQLFAMDTVMSFTATGAKSEEAVDAAMKEIQKLDALWSIGQTESEVSRINAEGGGKVSEDTEKLLSEAVSVYSETEGLFDFTVYPLVELWGFPTKKYRVPSQAELDALLPFVDASEVKLQNGEATLGENQRIDLGGIAKGYASSKVMEIFRQYGVKSGMVSLGGNIHTYGKRPDGNPWRIGLQDPESVTGDYLGVLNVEDKAVITSGGYQRYFEQDGKRYIHIIDPRTGKPAESDLLSATVVSENGALADGLSTALYIMGKEKAEEFWRQSKEAFDMLLVADDGTVYVSENLSGSFETERKTALVRKTAS